MEAGVPSLDLSTKDMLYYDGDAYLSGNIQGSGLIVVSGTANIIGDLLLQNSNQGVVLVANHINIDIGIASGAMVQGIIYTPNTLYGTANSVHIEGALITNKIYTENNLTVDYSQNILNNIPLHIWNYFNGVHLKTFGCEEKVN